LLDASSKIEDRGTPKQDTSLNMMDASLGMMDVSFLPMDSFIFLFGVTVLTAIISI